MANVIDEFVVKLGWDSAGFKRGGEEIAEAGKRTREGLKRGADDIEARNKVVGESFRNVKNEVVGLGSAFVGASGIKDFVSQIVLGDAATGRMAKNINVATRELSAWQGVVARVGGDPGDANSALATLQKAYQDFLIDGTTPLGPGLSRLGVTDPNDLKNPTSALLKFAEASEHMSRPEFVARMQRLGMPDSVINSLAQGRKHVEALLADQIKLGAATERDAEAAAKMQEQISRLASAVRGEARPEIEKLAGGMADFLTTADGMDAAKDTIIGVLGAITVAAVAALGPWIALAAAIGGVAYLSQHPEALGTIRKGPVGPNTPEMEAAGKRLDQYSKWDPRHYLNVHRETAIAGASTGGGGSTAGAGQRPSYQRFFERNGFTAEQANGIVAGIVAEGGTATAVNPTSGAFGIGQWLGARKAELFRRYGRHPTGAQQLEFLNWELHGGDSGAGAVRAAGTSDQALQAYITRFMRPGAGTAGDLKRGRQYLAGGGGVGARTTVNIGTITVNTKATDAKGIARDIGPALSGRTAVRQADSGATQRSALFPDVPDAPGVPPVLRDAANIGDEVLSALTGDALDPFSVGEPVWGIFDDAGTLVLEPDSFVSVEDASDRRVSTYPIEEGGFESYNKVAVPFETHVTVTKGGTISDKSAFIDTVKELTNSIKLYSIVTPEETFEKVNFVHNSKSRQSYHGATMLTIDLQFIEIRESATATFTNSKQPSGSSITNDGPVQPKTPPSGLAALSAQETNASAL